MNKIITFLNGRPIIGRFILMAGAILAIKVYFYPNLAYRFKNDIVNITIEDLTKKPISEIPQYSNITNAISSSKEMDYKSYYIERGITTKGDTVVSAIYYPLYSKSNLTNCKILVKDLNKKPIDLSDDYFIIRGDFAIEFQGETLSPSQIKILNEQGIQVNTNTIIVIKDGKHPSLIASIIWVIILTIISLLLFISILPNSIVDKLLNREPEFTKINN